MVGGDVNDGDTSHCFPGTPLSHDRDHVNTPEVDLSSVEQVRFGSIGSPYKMVQNLKILAHAFVENGGATRGVNRLHWPWCAFRGYL